MAIKCLREGVGICDAPTTTNGKIDKEYTLWSGILRRCYSDEYHANKPTYVNCEISDEWKKYSNFKRDIVSIHGFGRFGFQLDKDILVKGNKVYSKETVCFVPRQLNMLLSTSKRKDNDLPLGVSIRKYKDFIYYVAYCNVDGVTNVAGEFNNPDDAFLAYKAFKEVIIKEYAEKFKSEISEKVYNALIDWNVTKEYYVKGGNSGTTINNIRNG